MDGSELERIGKKLEISEPEIRDIKRRRMWIAFFALIAAFIGFIVGMPLGGGIHTSDIVSHYPFMIGFSMQGTARGIKWSQNLLKVGVILASAVAGFIIGVAAGWNYFYAVPGYGVDGKGVR